MGIRSYVRRKGGIGAWMGTVYNDTGEHSDDSIVWMCSHEHPTKREAAECSAAALARYSWMTEQGRFVAGNV